MKLYHSPASPFVRKVTVTLYETGLIDQAELVPATGTAMDPGTMPVAQNPLGKIPALERANGPAIHDSRVICRYLNDRAGTTFYPDAPRLWDTLTLESTADGIMEAAVLMVYEARCRPEDKQFDGWVEAQWLKITRSLDAIESRWMAHLAGPLDAAQIALGCALGYLDFRQPDRDWRKARPQLAAWAETFAARPSMQATKPA
ncbi:glutathione S-transferase [Halovulum sp. GXIMD14793]